MGKAAYKRFKKAEKGKVKLKGSKKLLPKGLNVTDTNFKVKKIIIKEQLSKHGETEVLSKKHLSVQDLISRLNHHNAGMKQEALAGLRELINKFSYKVIGTHWSSFLDVVMNLTLDKEGDVRTNTIKLLSLILKEVPDVQISPFFQSMNLHVMCAMTHIDPRIREDSLNVLDILIMSLPHLTAIVAPELLPYFLDLISDNKDTGRTLTLHLDGKMSSEKWRFRVFVKLKKLLELMLKVNKEDKKTKTREIVFNPNEPMHVSLYIPIKDSVLPLITYEGEASLATQIKDCTKSLVPLLMEAIIEAVPHEEAGENDEVPEIPLASAVFLHCIVDIIISLWDLLTYLDTGNDKFEIWFQSTYGHILSSKLLNTYFPYNARKPTKKASQDTMKIFEVDKIDTNCKVLNLEVCYICLQMTDLFLDVDKWKNCLSYLQGCLALCDTLEDKECSILVKCLQVACKREESYDEECSLLFDFAARIVYECKNYKAPRNKIIFNFLSEVALDNSLNHLHKASHFIFWLQSLPELLTQPNIPQRVVDTTVKVASRNFEHFLNVLDAWIESIIDNLPTLKVDGVDNLEAKKSIIQLLYWVRDWDVEMVDSLNKAVEDQYLGPELTRHLVDVLYLKYTKLKRYNVPSEPLLYNMQCWEDLSRV